MPRKFVTDFIPDFMNVRENRRGTNNRQSRNDRQSRNVDNIGHKTENEDKQKQKQKQKTTKKTKKRSNSDP